MNITSSEFKKFLILLGVLLFWFAYGINIVSPFIQTNFMIAYLIFIVADTYLVMKYVLLINPIQNWEKFIALIFVFLAMDIIMYPYLVTTTGLLTDNPSATMSSDVWIYKMLPISIPDFVRYLLVYAIIPALLLMCARSLTTKKWFWSTLRNGA